MSVEDNNDRYDQRYDGWLWRPFPEDETAAPAAATVQTTLRCPDWCEQPDGHPFESHARGLLRTHQRRFGLKPTHVALETYERAASAEGPTDLGLDPSATLVRLQFPHACGYLTADGARRLAALLVEAADAATYDATGQCDG